MRDLKRILVVFVFFVVTVVVSVGYKGNEISRRGIVLGVGVDRCENGVMVTVEVVSPGNGSEEVGTFSKTVSAFGKTVAEGLQNVAEKTGKETSLGQCVLIVYGEDMMRGDVSDAADYFIKSDSCKEITVVCCCVGTAQNLLKNSDALSQSVSLSLADKLKDVAPSVALPSCDLLTFSRSQREGYQTGYLNLVHFQQTEVPNQQQQSQGYFVSQNVVVFRNNKFVGVLSEKETQGLAVLSQNVSGNVFTVNDNTLATLRVNTKNLSASMHGKQVDFTVDLYVKLARTDSFGAGGKFTAKTESEITQSMLDQAKEQAYVLAQAFLQKQTQWQFDLIGLHELFRRQYGAAQWVKTLPTSSIPINLKITVQEK